MKKLKINITKKGVFRFIRQVIVSAIMLLVFGGVGVYMAFDSIYGNPDRTVAQLYENFYSNNWRMVYDMSEVEESDYVNYYTYAYVMNNLLEEEEKSTVVKGDVIQEGKQVTLDVLYGEGRAKKHSLILIEDEIEKEKLLFPVWKLDLDKEIITDVTIKVPFGYVAELDGINLVTCESTWLGEEQMIEYHIDRIFAGTHTLQCTRVGREDVLVNVELKDNGATYVVPEDEIKHDAALVENTVAVVFGLYKNALGNTGIEDLKGYFVEEQQEALQTIYDDLYSKINQKNGAMLKSMEVDSYKLKNGLVSDSRIEIIIDFECSYEAKKPRSNTSGVRKDYAGSTSSSVKLTYDIIEDAYKISGIEFECIDYSKEN